MALQQASPKKIYLGSTEVKAVYKGTVKVRPINTFTYDFTTGTHGRTAGSGTYQGSEGFYRSGNYTDGNFTAPSEIFAHTPKKITLTYNKVYADAGTGIGTPSAPWYSVNFPYDANTTIFEANANGTTAQTNLGSNPTGVVNWVMTIDSSTTNRTVKHKIGNLSEITDTSGIVKHLWDNNTLAIRIVNWTGNVYITGFSVEY